MRADRPVRLRRLGLAAALSLALSLTAACGDEDDPSGGGKGKDGLTAPGSILELGETATVPRTNGDGVVDMTVTEISRGEPSDIAEILKDAEGRVPYYVRFDLEVVSGDLQGFDIYDYVTAWSGEDQVQPLVYGGRLPGCHTEYWDPNPTVGATMEACMTVVAEKGDPAVDAVRFATDDAEYSLADGGYVEWSGAA